MNVHQRFLNPQALLSLYGEFPSLIDSEIIEFLLKRDEPRVSMKIMIKSKPKKAPARWSKNYDIVYLGISFIGAKRIITSGWGHTNIVNQFDAKNSDDLVSVHISCEKDISISFDCDWISIDSLTPGKTGSP